MRTEQLMRAIVKSVFKSVEYVSIRNQWVSTSYNVLGARHTKRMFLIYSVYGHVPVQLDAFPIQACNLKISVNLLM